MPDTALFLFKLAVGLVLGMVLGSFATMLAYRVPRKLSIVAPRSHCPSCKQTLQPRDLVPLFSYLFNKGQCRMCGVKIPPRYLIIELTITLLTTALVLILF
jgi:prepilin signal peptidase PulO-like enzyme (type II secretory pathway)